MSSPQKLALVTVGHPTAFVFAAGLESCLDMTVQPFTYEDPPTPNETFVAVVIVLEDEVDKIHSLAMYFAWRDLYPEAVIIWFTGDAVRDYEYLERLDRVERFDFERECPSIEDFAFCIQQAIKAQGAN